MELLRRDSRESNRFRPPHFQNILNSPNQPEIPQNPAALAFYEDALKRIVRLMVIAGVALTAAAWGGFGVRAALGALIGCAVAGLNFYWLQRVVNLLADRATASAGTGQSPRGAATRFILRYVLIALIGYVIVEGSAVSLHGFLAGLFLPVPAILFEAAYETYFALRRGY